MDGDVNCQDTEVNAVYTDTNPGFPAGQGVTIALGQNLAPQLKSQGKRSLLKQLSNFESTRTVPSQ